MVGCRKAYTKCRANHNAQYHRRYWESRKIGEWKLQSGGDPFRSPSPLRILTHGDSVGLDVQHIPAAWRDRITTSSCPDVRRESSGRILLSYRRSHLVIQKESAQLIWQQPQPFNIWGIPSPDGLHLVIF